jgi:DNA-binding beta-propeller fold protein YncE
VETQFVSGPASPFGVAVSSNSAHVFIADVAGALFVYSLASTTLHPQSKGSFANQSPVGLALTPNGRSLVAAEGSGAAVFDVARLETSGSPSSSWTRGTWRSRGQGAIEAAVSPDGHFVFVTLENSDEMAVFNLKKALAHGFRSSDLVGTVPLGIAPVGMAVSPGSHYLYVTSEATARSQAQGELTTIDIGKAERSPAHAVVSTVRAGCSPVRVVATRSSVYVTARGSDALLDFSAPALVSHPRAALVGDVRVGEAPVGLALVDHDTTIVIADSNRFASPRAGANLAVVTGASDGHLALAGYLRSGSFPRDMVASPNGKALIVSNYGSGQVETVDVAELP